MKICIVSLNIIPFFQGDRDRTFGGAEVQTAFLERTFRESGHEVTLVVADLTEGIDLPCPAENAFSSPDGIRGLRFFHPRWTGIMHALERADADIYYQRNAGMITGLVAMFCRRKGRTFVYGAGSDVDFSPRTVSIGNWRDRTLHRYGLHKSHGIVVQNRSQERAARERFDQPVRVIANGVRPIESTPADPDGTILWVGAMWSIKRPDLVLEIAKQLPGREFVIVGGSMSSEPELARFMRHAAETLPNVKMEGRLPRDQVQERMRRAALLINTSRAEGFPNAYLEAWNHGVPVVTMNDIDGIIGAHRVGVVCTTVDEMTAAIRSIEADPALPRDMGTRARALVQERFSPTVIGRQYTEFFQMLLAKSAGALT